MKNRSWSLFGGLLPVWSTTFLNPSKIITSKKYAQQIDDIHQKLHCLQLALFNRTGPILLHHITCPLIAQPTFQKLNELGYGLLPHLPCSPDLSLTDYHFFKHLNNFLQGRCFHNQEYTENAFQEFADFQRTNFYATGISLFPIGKNLLTVMVPIFNSCWQKCIDCDGSYFINKDVFQPNYTDLKFRVWNHSYFSTKLVFEKGQVENFWERVAGVYLLSHIEVRWVLTL